MVIQKLQLLFFWSVLTLLSSLFRTRNIIKLLVSASNQKIKDLLAHIQQVSLLWVLTE